MKYHWVSFVADDDKVTVKNNTNPSPSQVIKEEHNSVAMIGDPSPTAFIPQIIDNVVSNQRLDNMTKRQITEKCKRLSQTLSVFESESELFIGNCVVSNYHEDYQEINTNDQIVGTNLIRTNELKSKVEITCKTQLASKNFSLSAIEKELMIGVCVAAKI